MRTRRRPWVIVVLIVLIGSLLATFVWVLPRLRVHWPAELAPPPKPEAPPDLEKLRNTYTAALESLRRGDGNEAVRQLSSFTFGKRAVEQYRLYYLANGFQLTGNRTDARITLARLWARHPPFVFKVDAGLNLGALYAAVTDWRHAAEVYGDVATRAENSNVAANARWSAIQARFAIGDVASALEEARNITIRNPRAPQAANAIDIVRSLSSLGPNDPLELTDSERLTRAVGLLRDSDPQNALDELSALEASGVPANLRQPIQLNRGLALNQLRRFEDSNKVLEPLASGPYRFAVPAIYTAAKNYRALSASINPIVIKTITVRQRVVPKAKTKGTKKRVRSRFVRVKKKVQVVDLAKKAKKDTYDRLDAERLKDLLTLPLADEIRIEVLNALIAIAESKNQNDYERDLVIQLAALDALQEAGLQHFWDLAWAAYARGDLNGARDLLTFLRNVYRNPNVRRQAMYWYARCGERLGRKEESTAIYRELAAAPYDDLYAIESEQRGAARPSSNVNPLTFNRPDWRDIAEQNMPKELRLGYELTALSDMRDAQLEIQANRKRSNQQFADALLSDLYNSTGNTELMMKTLRAAYPALATVEQDSVPPYFFKMYYPLKYEDAIRKYCEKYGVDPYIVMGLIHQESYFNPRARSVVGAMGLMQVMPATGRELANQFHIAPQLNDPETNIRIGTAHFKILANLFNGNSDLAIAAYNAGQGRVQQWRRAAPGKPLDEFIEAIPFRETRTYVKHIVMLASTYRRMYGM